MSSVEELFEAMHDWPEVEAIALGGSRATGNADERSDYDVYLYVTAPVPTKRREKLLSGYCSHAEIDNGFWENEDDCTLNDGTDVDILYRDLDSFTNSVADVVERFHASNGYTTCLWHNMITSMNVFDRNGRFSAAQRRFTVPFPEPLRRNIIERNMRLLHGNLPSYDAQIRKAASRGDEVAVNHRVAAFMESYFDVIFALNRLTHPGEKHLEKLASRNCEILPKDFEANLGTLFGAMFTDVDLLGGTLQAIVDDLQRTVDTNL
ncbi:DUF4037 domain-containing protein [Bifidobacterium moukalabense]|uniref:Nucleotidyltransferase n=1 Tax=Bifidobacterium moukalabense DSM 27321 TaxID=1435051 RepID=W4N6K6_9BIFI|nr:DUF4037 domain-containing protein [Bifidobacterium moukalabense]ETY70728.1 nucleotidyltransferase [Bifidobacterium moukalabense DSM 27321]